MELRCPHCKNSLQQSDTGYACLSGHNFDVAKEGYVNLLLKQGKGQGDDGMMLQARRGFLEKGFYQPVVDKLSEIIAEKFGNKAIHIADLGCGEGRYMRALQKNRGMGHDTYFGIDISKRAVKMAAKSTEGIFVVGSTYEVPVSDKQCDVILSVFSPYDEAEIARLLKPGGIALVVLPGSDHLYRFIEMIWDEPHRHQTVAGSERYALLNCLSSSEIIFPLNLNENEDIQNLFKMTPYYWKAPEEKQQSILGLDELVTEVHMRVDVVSFKQT